MTEGSLSTVEKINVVVAIVLSALGFYHSSWMATSIAIGAAIAAINFRLLRILVRGLLSGKGNKAILSGLLFLKFMILFGVLAVVVIVFNCHLLGILVGLSSLLISFFGVFIRRLWNTDSLGFN